MFDKERHDDLRAKIQLAFAEAGPDTNLSRVESIEGSDDEKLIAIRAMNTELEALDAEYTDIQRAYDKAKAQEGKGAPWPVAGRRPGYQRSAQSASIWAGGHWGDSFLKGVENLGSFDPVTQAGLISSGTITVPSLSGGIVPIEDRPLSILQVIPTEPLSDTDKFAYLRETAREHKAAPTAKSTLKPTSKYQTKKVEDTVRTIAHLSEPVARQDLEDTSLLRSYIDGSMARGVQLALESEILSGEGEGQELTGLANTEGIQEQAYSESAILSARKALTKLEDKELPGGVFVMGTAHWEAIETFTTEDGIYVGGSPGEMPVDRMRKRLWGMPVITTTLLTGKLGYLVDFTGSTKLWERGGVRVDWSEAPEGSVEGESAFKSNELIFRGEGRWGFGVTRPSGIVEVGLQS